MGLGCQQKAIVDCNCRRTEFPACAIGRLRFRKQPDFGAPSVDSSRFNFRGGFEVLRFDM